MDHRRSLLIALALALALIAGSSPRLVGDGREYLTQALRFPSAYGTHFWFYALLATPGVWVTRAVGVNPLFAFTILNVAVLGLALRVALPRIGQAASLLVFGGPVVWWLDKAHTEAFTFAMITIAIALVRDRPWWSMIAASAAATQNPPIVALAGLVFLSQAMVNRPILRDRRFWAGALAALALAALHPLFYLWRYGQLSPLTRAARLEFPGATLLTATVLDPDIGLVANYPALAVAVVAALVAVLWARPRDLASSDVQVSWIAALVFLFASSQATNLHHGGTPSLSRYALWLVPLAVPLFSRAHTIGREWWRRAIWALAATSAVVCGFVFHPKVDENAREPTSLAAYLWTAHPEWNNPLPEVFSEALLPGDESWVPVATSGCEKIFVAGRGTWTGVWPLPCYPEAIPPRCQAPGVLCYANLVEGRYRFAEAPGPRDPYKLQRQWVWPPASEPHVRQTFNEWKWAELKLAAPGASPVEASADVDRVWTWAGTDRFLVVVVRPGASARLTLRLARAVTGRLIDAATGSTVQDIRGEASGDGRWELALPSGFEVLLLVFGDR